jgi:hypothetical protein
MPYYKLLLPTQHTPLYSKPPESLKKTHYSKSEKPNALVFPLGPLREQTAYKKGRHTVPPYKDRD